MAKITLSYLYNIFGSNILKIFNKDVKKILVFSPQRTFSNYFEKFMEINFFINFINTTNEVKNYDSKIHKHIHCPDLEYLKKHHSDCIIFVLCHNGNRNPSDWIFCFVSSEKIQDKEDLNLMLKDIPPKILKEGLNWKEQLLKFYKKYQEKEEKKFYIKLKKENLI